MGLRDRIREHGAAASEDIRPVDIPEDISTGTAADVEEIMKKYDLDTFDKAEKYTHELWLEAQKLRAP